MDTPQCSLKTNCRPGFAANIILGWRVATFGCLMAMNGCRISAFSVLAYVSTIDRRGHFSQSRAADIPLGLTPGVSSGISCLKSEDGKTSKSGLGSQYSNLMWHSYVLDNAPFAPIESGLLRKRIVQRFKRGVFGLKR